MDRLNDPTCPIGACKNTVKLHIGESIVTKKFGILLPLFDPLRVNLLSEAYTERVKKWQ